jgi:hypothetical protein
MNLVKAVGLVAMCKTGFGVRRLAWPDGAVVCVETGGWLIADVVLMWRESWTCLGSPWVASSADVLALDWVVVSSNPGADVCVVWENLEEALVNTAAAADVLLLGLKAAGLVLSGSEVARFCLAEQSACLAKAVSVGNKAFEKTLPPAAEGNSTSALPPVATGAGEREARRDLGAGGCARRVSDGPSPEGGAATGAAACPPAEAGEETKPVAEGQPSDAH